MNSSLVIALASSLGATVCLNAACSTSDPPPASSDAEADAGANPADGAGDDVDAGDTTALDAKAPPLIDADAREASPDIGSDAPRWVDPFGGASGCPDGGFVTARPECILLMPVSGGLSSAPQACYNSSSTSTIYYSAGVGSDELQIRFAQPFVRGMTASNLVASVSIQTRPTSGVWVTWTTPPTACSVTLTSNVCWMYLGQTYYLLSGTGTCSAPATPQPANGGPPVTIGDFSFAYVLNP